MCACVVVYFKEHVKHLYCKGQLDSTDSEDEDTSGSMYFDDSLSLLEFRGRHCHWPPACNCWWIIWSLCFSGSYKYRFFRSLPHFCFVTFFPLHSPMLSVSWTGTLPCGGWDCECAFRSQQGCCCVAKPLFELEEATFIRLVGLWEGLSRLNSQIEEVTGSHHNCHLTFTYPR